MQPLEKFLEERIRQIENRIMMIPRWEAGGFTGPKHYTSADLDFFNSELAQARAALKAVRATKAEEQIIT